MCIGCGPWRPAVFKQWLHHYRAFIPVMYTLCICAHYLGVIQLSVFKVAEAGANYAANKIFLHLIF